MLVVGGGLGGLAAAAALQNVAKIDSVTVVESRNDSLSNESAGAAIQLTPNAFKALEVIGGEALIEKIYEEGSELEENLILLPGGAPPMSMPNTAKAETNYPIVLVRWGVLRKLLGEMLPKDSILYSTGSDIVGYALDDSGDSVLPVDKDGNKVDIGSSPKLIVGADGLNSVFRDRIQTGTIIPEKDSESPSPLKDNGRVNIKAVVPMELKELGETFSNEAATFGQFDPQLAAFAGPAGTGYTYWAIAVADDPESGDKFVADHSDDKETAKKLLLEKLEANSSDAVNRDWIISLVEKTDPSAILIDRSQEATVEEGNSFVSKDGKVVLVGDAAHAMNPSYGQSASFAFEDAATLGLLLKEDDCKFDEALKEYSNQRVGRCMEIQRRSEERAAKAMRGEKTEDISTWIHSWDPTGIKAFV
eukprot:CAMPEP_0116129446 /NCGR_PEP_ID=MMETSP0329-20121206/7928_1 /TAXON_ID=697910 /ORGANISM="Pseudo-nitzschia arenysensis, Strain B593" /LENGTH=418 /DNA_ID=CAMNT_0003623713 /DNA_START=66 /DNA_END=1322 /DNA_ORIENTATION=+